MDIEQLRKDIENPKLKNFKNKEGYTVFQVLPANDDKKTSSYPAYTGITYGNENFLNWENINKNKWYDIFDNVKYIRLTKLGVFDSYDEAKEVKDSYVAYFHLFKRSCRFNKNRDTHAHKVLSKILDYKILSNLLSSKTDIKDLLSTFKLMNNEFINSSTEEVITEINTILKNNGSRYVIYKHKDKLGEELCDYYIGKNTKRKVKQDLILERKKIYKNSRYKPSYFDRTLNEIYLVYRKYDIDPQTKKEKTTYIGLTCLEDEDYKAHFKDEKLNIDIIKFFDKEEEAKAYKYNLLHYYSLIKHCNLSNNHREFIIDTKTKEGLSVKLLEQQMKSGKSIGFILTLFNRLYENNPYTSLYKEITAFNKFLENNNSNYTITFDEKSGYKEDIDSYHYHLKDI